jgi:hypothetical protein
MPSGGVSRKKTVRRATGLSDVSWARRQTPRYAALDSSHLADYPTESRRVGQTDCSMPMQKKMAAVPVAADYDLIGEVFADLQRVAGRCHIA